MIQFLLLIAGLVLIIKSADVLILSTSKIARRFGISTFVIGITVIAFGTSAPELVVGIVSGINQTNQLTLGNVLGSAMSNMALIMGISAVIITLQVQDSTLKREFPMLLLIELVLGLMLFGDGYLSRVESIILLTAFLFFMLYIFYGVKAANADGDEGRNEKGEQGEANKEEQGGSLIKLWVYALLSLGGLFLGGKMTVDYSSGIAQSFGFDETVIGLTVVALATTMPELITSIMATRKKEADIVLGNCLGSNIFNILMVLGVSALISPITVQKGIWIDIAAMLAITAFVFFVFLIKKKLNRLTGFFLITVYISYLVFKVWQL